MSEWQSGPPPAVGWWPAVGGGWAGAGDPGFWRWWDGMRWSRCAVYTDSEHIADYWASRAADDELQRAMVWRDWPENMRHLPGYPLRSES